MQHKELNRLETVHWLLQLNIDKQKELQDIVWLAAEICGTPTALITLMGEDTQYVLFQVGFNAQRICRRDSFCNHVIEQEKFIIVPDSLLDPKFAGNIFVVNEPNIRFYAGAPLCTQNGQTLGSLCVIDSKPGNLTNKQKLMLEILSRQVANVLEFRMSQEALKEQYVNVKNSEVKLRTILESAHSCYLLMGKDMEVLAFNRALSLFIKLMYNLDIETGRKATDFINKNYVDEFSRMFTASLAGESFNLERRMEYEGVGEIWWQLSYDTVYDHDGNVIGVSYNGMNISKRKQQELKILEQNKALSKIAQIHSHEFRSPVASILGLITLFKMNDYKDCEEYIHLLEQSVQELDRMLHKAVALTY